MKRVGILVVGWFFVGLGIIGLFLPFLQGILFIMIGLVILAPQSQTIDRFLRYLENHYPQHHERVRSWNDRVKNWFGKDRL